MSIALPWRKEVPAEPASSPPEPSPAENQATSATPAGPHRVIVPRRGIQLFNLKELWDYRDIYVQFSKRDVTLRYRQTALGVIWVILQPVIGAGIFSFVFGSVAHLQSDGVPYFLFAFIGLWIWNAFSSTIGNASQSLLNYSTMLTKVFFPRVLLPLSVTSASVINAAVSFGMMLVLLFVYHVHITWQLATLPFWLALALLLAQGPALLFSSLMVRFRDVAYVQPVLINFLMFLSPVAYSSSAVKKYAFIVNLNPLTGLLNGTRWAVLGRGTLNPAETVYTVVTCVVFAVVGAFVFEQLERTFTDVI